MTFGVRPDDHIGANRRHDDRRVGGGPKEERQARASGQDGGERRAELARGRSQRRMAVGWGALSGCRAPLPGQW
jgi:hypothetical protein